MNSIPTANKTIVDLHKVQYAQFYYRTNEGCLRDTKPTEPTAHGCRIENEYAGIHHDYPCETMLERAIRLDILDVWYPVCRMQLTANHSLIYTGTKAEQMWRAWNAHVFSLSKKRKK